MEASEDFEVVVATTKQAEVTFAGKTAIITLAEVDAKPGDFLFISVPSDLTRADIDRLSEHIRNGIPGVHGIVIAGDMPQFARLRRLPPPKDGVEVIKP